MQEMIELESAWDLLLTSIQRVDTEEVSLQSSLGRVLAERVTAVLDIPPFDRSPLDGYALLGEDTLQGVPVDLKLLGEIPAGSFMERSLEPGTAVKVLTGSPLPPGANAVIRQEDTQEHNDTVRILQQVKPGANLSRRAEDITHGEVLLEPGQLVTPAVIGVLASQGVSRVKVYRRPRIAVASSGDELVQVGKPLAPGHIYNTNLYTLAAQIEAWGGEAISLGQVKDQEEVLAGTIEQGLKQGDLVVTTGGASVGTYDVTLKAMERAGAEVLFWRVAMKPGTPVICGRKGGKLILGLSGNPAAAMISASLLLGPLVCKLGGRHSYYPRQVQVISRGSFHKSSGIRRMIRARVAWDGKALTASFPTQQQPGVLKSMLATNALIDLPPGQTLESGKYCKAFLLDEWEERHDTGHIRCR